MMLSVAKEMCPDPWHKSKEMCPDPWHKSTFPWHKPQGLPEGRKREPIRTPIVHPPMTTTPLLDSIITMEALYLDYDEALDKYHVDRDQKTLDSSSEARRKYVRSWQMVELLHTNIIIVARTQADRMHWQERLDTRIYVKNERLVRGSNRLERTQQLIAQVELEDRVAVEREHQKRTAKLGPIQAGLRAELMQPTIKAPPVLQTETSPTHLRIWLARFKAYREGAKLDCCSRIVAFEHILTLLDDSLCKKIIADRLGRVDTFGINEIIVSIKKAFLMGYPLAIRRLALIKHQRKHSESIKDYFLRLQFDRKSAAEETKTPGEVLAYDIIRGINCPELVELLHNIADPTVEKIAACIDNFDSREAARSCIRRNYVQRKPANKPRPVAIAPRLTPSSSNSSVGDMEAAYAALDNPSSSQTLVNGPQGFEKRTDE